MYNCQGDRENIGLHVKLCAGFHTLFWDIHCHLRPLLFCPFMLLGEPRTDYHLSSNHVAIFNLQMVSIFASLH